MSTTPGNEPPAKISETFNASDADVILVSSDNVGFRVHRANLCASSTIFKDMFDVGSEVSGAQELPTVPLQESSATLEVVLPYIYPKRLKSFALEQLEMIYQIIRALDKYGIERGMEAVLGCLVEQSLVGDTPTDASTAILTLALAVHMGRKHLQDLAVKRLVKDHNLTPEELIGLSKSPAEHLPSATPCFAKLRKLLIRRKEALRRARESASTELVHALQHLGELYDDGYGGYITEEDPWRTRCHSLSAALFLWDAVRDETTSASMAELEKRERAQFTRLERDDSVSEAFRVAWSSQLECLSGLPDTL
ncbi:hypothetical protein BCR35DRAFT_352127 [Leucosporidium creatinivorum]|uniref:BTB domain-containing protein n=1 Tax=Leucosporidium creatinivorum TaxID=106004 RepID=A0A1Y2FG99_9BASI|nr:hypothetical protein BCR35DRAFT_352127 [Leucosporidium creatinivorum]